MLTGSALPCFGGYAVCPCQGAEGEGQAGQRAVVVAGQLSDCVLGFWVNCLFVPSPGDSARDDETLPESPCITTINLFDSSSSSNSSHCLSPSHSPRLSLGRIAGSAEKTKSLPRSMSLSPAMSPQTLSPVIDKRSRAQTSSPNTLSPVIRRRNRSQSPNTSPKGVLLLGC